MKPDRTERWNIRRHKHLKMSIFRKSSAQIPTPRKNNSSAFAFFHESIERTQIKKALQLQSFQKTRGPFFDKNVRKTDLIHMVRVGRLELPASCSQMCVWTFSRHFTALFGPFRCLGSSSSELFYPACFKKPFRLLGFVWDWILCIKRYSAQLEGAMAGQSPQNRGAETAPHKQRIRHSLQVAWKVNSFYHAAAKKTTKAYMGR